MRPESDAPHPPRGFAGLASLISRPPEASAPPRESIVSPRSTKPSPPARSGPAPKPPSSARSGSPSDADPTERASAETYFMAKMAVFAFGMAFVATGIVLVVQSSTGPHQPPTRSDASSANADAPRQTSALRTLTSRDLNNARSTAQASPVDESLGEVPPPQGANRQLDASEINYCLSERVRVDAMRSLIDDKSEVQVENFGLRLRNFKLRCTKLLYRDSDMDQVKKSVDARISQLLSEAESTVSRWRK